MTPQVIALTGAELEALHGAGPLAVAVYLHLRAWMDYGTGITGRSRPVSIAMLAAFTETHTTRGAGVQVTQPTEKELRNTLNKLQRGGLLIRRAGERLLFSLPMALVASARPNQTGRDEGTISSTEQGTVEPLPALAMQAEPGSGSDDAIGLNRAHIMYQVNLNPTRRPVDKFGQGSRPARARSAEGGSAIATDSADHARLLMIGQDRAMPPRPGESWQDYRNRLLQARKAAPDALPLHTQARH